MATVQAQVKESLLGTTREPELSTQTRQTFDRHAKKDETTGEFYMTEHEFVDAIAPATEDYVSQINFAHQCQPNVACSMHLTGLCF